MELLLLLVQRRGQLVTREAIARSLWPGLDVEDLTARINAAVAQIRGALDDDAAKPRYIETVIGKGYRFVAVVEEIRVTELVAAGHGHEAAQELVPEPALSTEERFGLEVPGPATLELIAADNRLNPVAACSDGPEIKGQQTYRPENSAMGMQST
jgi:DNA-binding winged helix-turn-helix (wHTH) protein